MINRLPQCFQYCCPTERKILYTNVMKSFEDALVENDFEKIEIALQKITQYHNVHKLGQDQKHLIYTLLVNFITQKYNYKTRYIFSNVNLINTIDVFLRRCRKNVYLKCQIDWLALDKIGYELFVNDLANMRMVGTMKSNAYTQFQKILKTLRTIVPSSNFENILKAYINSPYENLIGNLMIVRRSENSKHYKYSFDLVHELQINKLLQKPIDLTEMAKQKPDLITDQFIENLLETIYHRIICFIRGELNIDVRFDFEKLVILIAPVHKFPNREQVWVTIERILTICRDYLHPSNNQNKSNSDYIFTFICRFMKAFTYRVLFENKQLEKTKINQINSQNKEKVKNINTENPDQFLQVEKQQLRTSSLKGQELEQPKSPTDQFQFQGDDDKDEESFDMGDEFLKDYNEFTESQKMDEIDSEQSDGSSDEENVDQIQYENYYIDNDGISRFINLLRPFLKYQIYSNSAVVAQFYKLLSKLRPADIIPEIMEQIQIAFSRGYTRPLMLVKIYEMLLPNLFHKDYPDGVNYIPSIFSMTLKFIPDHGDQIWRFYDILFQTVPIYDENDLLEEFSEVSLQNKMNNGVDTLDITKRVSEMALEAFSKYILTFEYSDTKYKLQKGNQKIISSIKNKFYNFVFQCSKKNFRNVIQIVTNYLENFTQNKVNNHVIELLHAIILRDQRKFTDYWELFSGKILRTQNGKIDFCISNPDILQTYLTILAEIVLFAGKIVKSNYPKIKELINISIIHENTKIQEIGQLLLSQVLLSQVAIYIADFYPTNDGKLNLKWARSDQPCEPYRANWVQNNDQEFLIQLMNDFYYPCMSALRVFIKKHHDDKFDVHEYLKVNVQNIIYQLNEPICSQNMQEIDLKTRREIGRQLEIVQNFQMIFGTRCAANIKPIEKLYQHYKSITFACLDSLVSEINCLIIDFFPIYAKLGLSPDNKVNLAYRQLFLYNFGTTSNPIENLAIWIRQKSLVNSSYTGKQKLNRYLKNMFMTYFLNQRVQEMFLNEWPKCETIHYIRFILCFEDTRHRSQFVQLNSQNHTEMKETIKNIFNDLFDPIRGILTSKFFNQTYIDGLGEAEKQKISHFQISFLTGLFEFISSCSAVVGAQLSDFFLEIETIYQCIINRRFVGEFNTLLNQQINFVEDLLKGQFQIENIEPHHCILSIQSPDLIYSINTIIQKRQEYLLKEFPNIIQTYNQFQQKRASITEKWICQDEFQTRPHIVTGRSLILLSGDFYLQQAIMRSLKDAESQDLNVRSLGRVLALILMLKTKQQFKSCNYRNVDLSEFTEKIEINQYLTTCYLLQKDKEFVKQNNLSKVGFLTPYQSLKYQSTNYSEVKNSLICVIQFPKVKLMQMIKQDLGILKSELMDVRDQSTLFSDVLNTIIPKLSSFQKYTPIQPLNQLPFLKTFKLLKFLFGLTDFEMYRETKHLFTFNEKSLLEDKETQQQLRVYYLALLKAAHSKWPIQQSVKQIIIQDVLEYFDFIIADQSRDEFNQFSLLLSLTMMNNDCRNIEFYLCEINKKINICDNDNSTKLSRWITILAYSMINQPFYLYDKLGLLNDVRIDYADSKLARSILINLQLIQRRVHIVHQLKKYNLEDDLDQNALISYKLKTIWVEESKFQQQCFQNLQGQFVKMQYNQRSNLIFHQFSIFQKIQHTQPHILFTKLLPIFFMMLQQNEEQFQSHQEVEFLKKFLNLFTAKMSGLVGFELIEMIGKIIRESQGKVRARAIAILSKIATQSSCCDRVRLLLDISQYINEDHKSIQDSCAIFSTQILQTMTNFELETALMKLIEKMKQNENELNIKLVLMSFILAHPYFTFKWTNNVLRIVLQKSTPLVQKQKSFAAEYLKLYRSNLLVENEEHQIEIEFIEKMSELSNPFNYFA